MPCPANFAATWPTPQMRQSSTMTETAAASTALRSSLIPSYYHRMQLEARLGETLDWLFRTAPPAAVDAKARLLVMDTVGCVLAARRHPEVAALQRSLEAADPGSVHSSAALFATASCWDEACEGLARAHG